MLIRLITFAVTIALLSPLSTATAQQSPFAPREYGRGELKVTVGSPRMIMRGPMFPWAMLFDDGSIIVASGWDVFWQSSTTQRHSPGKTTQRTGSERWRSASNGNARLDGVII